MWQALRTCFWSSHNPSDARVPLIFCLNLSLCRGNHSFPEHTTEFTFPKLGFGKSVEEVSLGASSAHSSYIPWATQTNVPSSSWQSVPPLFFQDLALPGPIAVSLWYMVPFLPSQTSCISSHLSKCLLRVRQDPNTVPQAWHGQRGENVPVHICIYCRVPWRVYGGLIMLLVK